MFDESDAPGRVHRFILSRFITNLCGYLMRKNTDSGNTVAALHAPMSDHVLNWKCRTFYHAILLGLIPVTVLPLALFAWFRQWRFVVLLLALEGVFAGSCVLARRSGIFRAVHLTLAGATVVSFYYLIQTGRLDTLFFMVFVIVLTGIFLGPAAAFFWSALHSLLLIVLAGLSGRFTIFPDMTIYFGLQEDTIELAPHFSTFILLYMVSAILSILFERYFMELLHDAHKAAGEKTVLESELFQAQKLESIALLAGGIAHDFNHGLTSIKSCANLILKKTTPLAGDIRKYAANIHDTCVVISGTTSRLLAFTRKSKTERGAVNVHEVVQSMLILLKYQLKKNVTAITELKAEPCVVIGDFSQLQSVVMNLALNAGDAMPGGGTLTISTMRSDRPNKHAGNGVEDHIVLTVRDTGNGIDEVIRSRLFTPFFTTKEKGTGLGLSVVDRIVKNHGGLINVTSEPGRGSAFSVFLPAAPRPGN